MSAFYSFVGDGCVEIITDCAVFDYDGVIRLLGGKVMLSKRLPVAMTGRGDGGDLNRTVVELMALDSAPTVEAMLDDVRTRLASMDRREAEVLIAVASPKGASHHFIALHDRYPEAPAGQLRKMPDEFGAGPPISREDLPKELHDLIGRPLFPLMAGPAIMEAMRRKLMTPHGYSTPVHAIGGAVQRTLVTLEGCSTWTLHVWPEDRVGEKIKIAQALPARQNLLERLA